MTTPSLNQSAAEAVDRIATSVMSATLVAIELMRDSGGWRHLGFASFEDWARSQSKPQLTPTERKELVADLAENTDMTQREIAAVVGVGKDTVNRDLASQRVSNETNEASIHAQNGGVSVSNETSTHPLGLPIPAPQRPSPEADALLSLLKGINKFDVQVILNGMTVEQHAKLRVAAKRALKLWRVLDADLIVMDLTPNGKDTPA